MFLTLKSESLGQFNTKHVMFEPNCHLDRIAGRSNILKNFIYLFLLIAGEVFLVPIQCSFAKLQLNVAKKF